MSVVAFLLFTSRHLRVQARKTWRIRVNCRVALFVADTNSVMHVSDISVAFLRNKVRPSSPWEADSLSADQDMCRILWNKGGFLCSQKLATSPSFEPDEAIPHFCTLIIFVWMPCNLPHYLYLPRLPSYSISWV